MKCAIMKRLSPLVLGVICGAVLEAGDVKAADPFTPPNFPLPKFKDARFNVRDFGATGNGLTNDTPAINKAIEKCSGSGGGDVVFPAGTYSAASIHLQSNVRFVLDQDAVITGADGGYDAPEPNEFDKYQDYGHSHFRNALMWGENIENFAIIGGKVNGGHIIQGDPKGRDIGDKVVSIKVGKNLLFKDVTHQTGGHFVYLLNDCENITFTNIVIKKSRDAVDLMGCRNVQISGCHFTGCSDDTIGVKSDYALGRRILSENIYVWDCYFESGCNGLQFGSETAGDFRNINFWNIRIALAMKAGIGITCNDSAIIENVNYRDITISKAASPIFMLITDRLRTGEKGAKVGAIRNVKLSNITITDVVAGRNHGPASAATISGRPDAKLENITLQNVKITYKGGSKAEEASVVPPYPREKYQPNGFGPRPASGFYIRHVKDLTFRNVEVAFESPDPKSPLVASDVDGFVLDGFKSQVSEGVKPAQFENVKRLSVKNSPVLDAVKN
jgi:polygalacturonase